MQIEDIFADLPTLEAARLRLRPITRDDVDAIFAYASDPIISAQTTWQRHRTRGDSLAFVRFVQRLYRQGDLAPWGVELRESGSIIGTCGFGDWEPRHRRAEIGYALSRRYWNQGLMTEAVQRVIEFGFAEMDLNRIQAMCLPQNKQSARVMKKVGMVYEGRLRQHSRIKGEAVDLLLYAILRQDWEPPANEII